MPKLPHVTERSYYPPMLDFIKKYDTSAASEIMYESQPDIVFRVNGDPWILSVKIGSSPKIQKDALIQYLIHKEDTGYAKGLLVFLDESSRNIPPDNDRLADYLAKKKVHTLFDTGKYDERGDLTFEETIEYVFETLSKSLVGMKNHYSIATIENYLKAHVEELMEKAVVSEEELARLITNEALFKSLVNSSSKNKIDAISKFLASYIMTSQFYFLRLLAKEFNQFAPARPLSVASIRDAFRSVMKVDYKPIFGLDVFDCLQEVYILDTFRLVWNLGLENIKYDFPGRIFHILMPSSIRKLFAAFYTKPIAADLLASLAVNDANATALDLACGSGTILVSAYKRKRTLFNGAGNPHRRFVESEIYGSDIMPFAINLTVANLASMDVSQQLDRTRVFCTNSLTLTPGVVHSNTVSHTLFPSIVKTASVNGETEDFQVDPVDVVLMNPPFTKVERGIRDYVEVPEGITNITGSEIGLWGFFLALGYDFLKDLGTLGAVIPINLLRGRESKKIRDFILQRMSDIIVVKTTRDYAFSENAEYRDILLIARKKSSDESSKIKFCLIKKPLSEISEEVETVAELIKSNESLRSEILDIDSHNLAEVCEHRENLMWFVGGTDFSDRDIRIDFLAKNNFLGPIESVELSRYAHRYYKEGYRPVPRNISKVVLLTRNTDSSRIEEANLYFDDSDEKSSYINVKSRLGTVYEIPRDKVIPTIRTMVGINAISFNKHDYLISDYFPGITHIASSVDFDGDVGASSDIWRRIQRARRSIETHLAVAHRINPFSPNVSVSAVFSEMPFYPTNQLNVVLETSLERAKAMCVIYNSVLFWIHFFMLKEESTGRNINVRFYDLEEMKIYLAENSKSIVKLSEIYEEYCKFQWPAISHQFDSNFEVRYRQFTSQPDRDELIRLPFEANDQVEEFSPYKERLRFDRRVCEAIGADVSEDELREIYGGIVREMFRIRSLSV